MKVMKTRLVLLALLSAFSLQPSAVLAQGSLTPPGAPAPTMKSLDQIEPRTPISSAPFTITNPGSYYLTANINVSSGNAITIATNGVTLDLNGFTISSTEASPTGTGILIGLAMTDIIILNGHIKGGVTYGGGVYSGSGFANGIEESGSAPLNVRVTGVTVSGCMDDGIAIGSINSTVVESCTVLTVGGYGIEASSVLRSYAKNCGNVAISADTASDSYGNSSGSSDGVDASDSANHCTGYSTSGIGLNTAVANNCYGVSLTGDGIDADLASGSEGTDFGGNGTGISAKTAQNCYGYSPSGDGIYTDYNVINSYGESGSAGYGIYTGGNAENCSGRSSMGVGIDALTAQCCFGYSSSFYGLYAHSSASGCIGYSSSGTGLYAFIANVCQGETSTGTALSTTHNVNSY